MSKEFGMSGNGKVNHASVVVPIRPGTAGRIEVMAFLYTKDKQSGGSFTTWKFATETGEQGESPWQTASNGIRDELSDSYELPVLPDNVCRLDFRSIDPVGRDGQPPAFLVSRFSGDPARGFEWHDKYVFPVYLNPNTLSHLRKKVKDDDKGETLGIPEFVDVGELWLRMKERGQAFHRAVLFRIIARFAGDRRSASFELYRGILEDPKSLDLIRNRDGIIRFNGES